MIYNVRHRTTYKYESVVTFARCVTRLKPQSSARQTVTRNSILVDPKPAHSLERPGLFGEPALSVVIDTPHKVLVVEARSQVEVHAAPVDAPEDSPSWENVREAAFGGTGLDVEDPAVFVYPSGRTPLTPAITDYARALFTPGRPIIEAAAALMNRIHEDFAYDNKATTVSTPAAEAFAARRGVCQDFAHVMLSSLRGLGLPAAYVSGYLRTIPPPGRPRLEGADATHAWVRVWCGPERGWIGFDPTNAIFALDSHIVLAVGRDYGDVAPIDGIMLSPGKQTLKVEVDVAPLNEPGSTVRSLAAHSAGRS